MSYVCHKLWVMSFPRQENRLFLPPAAHKTQISTFCFFVFPEISDLFTVPSYCRLTTWVWAIPLCQFFYVQVVFIKSFATWPVRDNALSALRCHEPDPVRSMVRQLLAMCSFSQLHEPPPPPSRNKRLQFTCSLFLSQILPLRLCSLCGKVE